MKDILDRHNFLVHRLIDPDYKTYLAARRDLLALPSDESIELAWTLGREYPGQTRMRMANILATKAPDLTHKLALMLLDEPWPGSVFSALDHLISADDGSQTSVAQQRLLHHPDAIVRLKAACYLACFGDESHLATLRSRLGDEGQDEEGRTVGGECRDAIYNIQLRLAEAGRGGGG